MRTREPLRDPPPEVQILRSVLPNRDSVGYRQAAREPGALALCWRWFRPRHVATLVFSMLWDGFLVVWFTIAATLPGPMGIAMMCCPIVHVLAGLAITYIAVAGLLNRTHVGLEDGWLSVHHEPLPWPGGGRYPAAEIRSVGVREQRLQRGQVGYELVADLGSRTAVLAKGFRDRAVAEYIADLIEAHLDLAD